MGIGAHFLQFRYFFRDIIVEIEAFTRAKKYVKVRETLIEAVTFHNDVKELVNIYELFI